MEKKKIYISQDANAGRTQMSTIQSFQTPLAHKEKSVTYQLFFCKVKFNPM